MIIGAPGRGVDGIPSDGRLTKSRVTINVFWYTRIRTQDRPFPRGRAQTERDMAGNTLPEQIAKQLRRDILRGRLLPGAAIKERDNAAELGVSRTPMREAIRILAKEGLVILRPSRSPIVAKPDIGEISDQIEVLLTLEKRSAELACAAATTAEIDRIAAMVDHMAAVYAQTDPLDMFELDMGFHTAIAQASHNRALAETHLAFLSRLWRARYLSAVQRRNRERLLDEHGAIVTALRARDGQAVRAAIHDHLWRLADDIRAVMEQENNAAGASVPPGPEADAPPAPCARSPLAAKPQEGA